MAQTMQNIEEPVEVLYEPDGEKWYDPEIGRKTSKRRICFWAMVLDVILLIGGMPIWYFLFFNAKENPKPIATCNECYCIAAEGENCPYTAPVNVFSPEQISIFNSQRPLNAYRLNCNPYENETCNTQPPQNETLLAIGAKAVCAVHYESNSTADDCVDASYRLVTYPSWQDAEAAGGFVTHAGHCGVCSTMQDLAVYLQNPDLTTLGKFCGKQVALGWDHGIKCYRELGMTEDCALIWATNSWNTAKECWKKCVHSAPNKQNYGPPPFCKLNDCLHCDEEKSGPIFKRIGGRTRRRSGLLSAIVRPCDQLLNITQQACPDTLPSEANS